MTNKFLLPFTLIRLQLIGECNRKCGFCPRAYLPKDKLKISNSNTMTLDTLEKLMKKLYSYKKYLKSSMIIAPYFMSEPLMIPNLDDYIRMIRKYFRSNFMNIHTNGDYLTYDKAISLWKAGLNMIIVNCYDKKSYSRIMGIKRLQKYMVNYSPISDKRDKNTLLIKVNISYGDKFKKTLNNRSEGGKILKINKRCSMPFRSLNILNSGDVILCCNDYQKRTVVGNILDSSLKSIYYSKKALKYRNNLYNANRNFNGICKTCDYKGGAYLHNISMIAKEDWILND